AALDHEPVITMDDGADLVSMLHKDYAHLADKLIASMEETTTGVIRLRALAADGKLRFPSSRSTTRVPSTSSTTATARVSRRSMASSARPTCCSPASAPSSRATAGAARASRRAPAAWAQR